jgi:hypothetical protein
MAKLADRRLIRRRLIAKIDAGEIPHRGAVIEANFGLRVRYVESLLQKAEAQHPINPDRRAASFARGVMGRNQGRERGSRKHKVHLGQKALSPCLLVGAIQAEAGEAFLLHGGHAQRLKGRCKADSENSDRLRGQIYIRGA